jgi:hypothetical protein
MKKLVIIFLIMLVPRICNAATVYLDIAATGCNMGGNPSTNYDPATRTCGSGSAMVYAGNYPFEASTSLSSGDHLYIRGGTYYEDIRGKKMPGGYRYQWLDGALHITQNNITVENYDGEVVWIQSGADHVDITVSGDWNNPVSVWGTGNRILGNNGNFFVWGCLYLSGTGTVIDGLDISGGWDHQSGIGADAWPDVIRVEGANVVVRNCNVHDNYDFGITSDCANNSLIMHENDHNSIFENNHFYNPLKGYVITKYEARDTKVHATYRYNVFESSASCPFTGTAIYHGGEVRVYQNVMIGGSGQWFSPHAMNKHTLKVYNNTFYNVDSAVFTWTGTDSHDFYNNIVYADKKTSYGVDYREIPSTTSYINYNDYYATGNGTIRWRLNYFTYSTLSSWQRTRSGPDVNSVSTNPNFLNASGRFDRATDFKRSSYPTNGRGGSYPLVMGAYITGGEIIGTGAVSHTDNRR